MTHRSMCSRPCLPLNLEALDSPSKSYRHCFLSYNPQGQFLWTKLSSCPSLGTLENLRGPVMGEAILPLRVDLRVDRWKNRFAVDLESSPQGLSDLLCVCNQIIKLPKWPLNFQQPPSRP